MHLIDTNSWTAVERRVSIADGVADTLENRRSRTLEDQLLDHERRYAELVELLVNSGAITVAGVRQLVSSRYEIRS